VGERNKCWRHAEGLLRVRSTSSLVEVIWVLTQKCNP
jgi:hypothetical protein